MIYKLNLNTTEWHFCQSNYHTPTGVTYTFSDDLNNVKSFKYAPTKTISEVFNDIRLNMYSGLTQTQKINYTILPFILTNSEESPRNIDFDLYGLKKVETINKGELNKIEYFNSNDVLVLTEYRTFIRDSLGIVKTRETKIEWYLTDGTVGDIKTWTKVYSNHSAIDEGVTRRTNIINDVKYYISQTLSPTNFADLLNTYQLSIDAYVTLGQGSDLVSKIQNSLKSYLTSEIKNQIITRLKFWV